MNFCMTKHGYNHLYTNLIPPDLLQFDTVHCIYLGVSGRKPEYIIYIYKSVVPDETQQHAAFHLERRRLQKYSIRGFPNTKGKKPMLTYEIRLEVLMPLSTSLVCTYDQ